MTMAMIKLCVCEGWFEPLLFVCNKRRSRGDKTFLCPTQLSMKFILLINVKMPTTADILTFLRRIYTVYESFKARKVLIFQCFSLYEHLKFYD